MSNKKNESFVSRVIGNIERIGNKLPHPFIIFFWMVACVFVLSWLLNLLGVTVVNPVTNETVAVKSLLSREGISWFLQNMIKNFSNFSAFGLVLVMCMGVGIAESTGLISAVLRNIVTKVPGKYVTLAVFFVGVMGNAASDAGYVVIPPLGGLLFLALGRNPIAGVLTAYIGCAGGHNANILLASTDVTLTGITNSAMEAIDPSFSMPPTSNWFFMIVSTFLLAIVGSIIMEKVVEPQCGVYTGSIQASHEKISSVEKKGLRNAGIAMLLYIVVILAGLIPHNGVLRGDDGSILNSPFLKGIIPVLFFFFVIVGITYGKTVGTIKKSSDIVGMMGDAMKNMSGFIVLMFVCGQFANCFNWTNLGLVLAVEGADLLGALNLPGPVMGVIFILICGFVNLFVPGASDKWAMLAPMFVPMLALLGYSPAFSQICFRIGDSISNPITPLFPYMPALLSYTQKYDKNMGVGTLITRMLPFSAAFFAVWAVQMILWFVFNLPLGPGIGIAY